MAMTNTQFTDYIGSAALPAVNSQLKREYALHPQVWPLFMNRMKSMREIEQKRALIGFGPYVEIEGEMGTVKMDRLTQDFNTTFRHRRYGKAMALSADLNEDDNNRVLAERVPEMARAELHTMNLLAFNVLNNAFTTNGYDGVPLCSASHPSRRPGVINQSNVLAVPAALSHTTAQVMQTQFYLQRDSSGKPIMVTQAYILVHPNQYHLANEIFKSDSRSDTANEATNALKYFPNGGIPQIITSPLLTNTNVSFMIAPAKQNGLVWFDRRTPYQKDWYDNPTETQIIARRFRCSQGWFDFRGILGNAGA